MIEKNIRLHAVVHQATALLEIAAYYENDRSSVQRVFIDMAETKRRTNDTAIICMLPFGSAPERITSLELLFERFNVSSSPEGYIQMSCNCDDFIFVKETPSYIVPWMPPPVGDDLDLRTAPQSVKSRGPVSRLPATRKQGPTRQGSFSERLSSFLWSLSSPSTKRPQHNHGDQDNDLLAMVNSALTNTSHHAGYVRDNDSISTQGDKFVVQWEGLELGERKSRFATLRDNRDVTILHTGFGFCGVGVLDVLLVQYARTRCFQFTIVSVVEGGGATNSTAYLCIPYQKLLAVVDQAEIQCLLYDMLDDYEDDDSARPDSTAALRTATLQVMTAYLLAHLAVYKVTCADTLVADMVCFPGEEGAVECCRRAYADSPARRKNSHFKMQTIVEGPDSPPHVLGEDHCEQVTAAQQDEPQPAAAAQRGDAAGQPATVSVVPSAEATAAAVSVSPAPAPAGATDSSEERPNPVPVPRPTQSWWPFAQLRRLWAFSAYHRSKVVPTHNEPTEFAGEGQAMVRGGGARGGAGKGSLQRMDSGGTFHSANTAHTAHTAHSTHSAAHSAHSGHSATHARAVPNTG